MIKFNIIIIFLSALPLLGVQDPANQIGDELLNTLTFEQKVSTYSLAKSVENLSYTSKVKLIFNDRSSKYYRIAHLLETLKKYAPSAEKPNKLTNYIKFHTKLKIKEIKEIKLFLFDKNGEKMIKFESDGLKIGKRKIGPFEVPSNRILIASPRILYY